ncbi:NAD(P)-binding protein [Aulographum hederae CBS 113979]|uniref:NAD(P)-binding protein n=1 Tax=Aulographum hederae CBS 113979 TaxID=1176131 RepID=A0A6G1GWI7_9PEZI|nr:NAD(P)-binding protein [Aulographum hederae CBS 113979]
MSPPTTTRQWILANKPTDLPVFSGPNATFKLETKDLPPLKDGQVLIQAIHLSNDPAQRGWIDKHVDPARLYVPPVQVGDIMRASAVCKVVASKAPKLKEGDLIQGFTGWAEFAVVDADTLNPIPGTDKISPTHALGALGLTGLTAWYGMVHVVGTKKEDAVVISGAAGATGQIAVQIAKNVIGCRKVIGIAGGTDKCKFVESIGADVCLDYKSGSFQDDVSKAVKEAGGAEVYFDNVGGQILDQMLSLLNRHGRVAACGAISDYNSSEKNAIRNYFEVISNRLEIKGFIIFDMYTRGLADEGLKALTDAAISGKIKLGEKSETIVKVPFEKVPETWMMLFEGGNWGKLVTTLE